MTNHPNVKVLFDIYHFYRENEPWSNMIAVVDKIVHVHLADTGRLYPGSGTYDYDTMQDILSKHGYAGRISCECTVKDFKFEAQKSIEYIKRKFNIG
jgi:sugar phosphate isomerase/epimerase